MEREPRELSPILDDRPTYTDALDFAPYRDTLVDIIADPATRTPLTIGIFGGWGSGKTSLMQMVSRNLKEVLAGGTEDALTVWFNAWKYGKEEILWRALLLHVLDALRPDKPKEDNEKELKEWRDLDRRLDDLQTSLYRDVEREETGGLEIDWGKMGTGVFKGAVKLGLSFIPGYALINDLVEAGAERTEQWSAEVLEAVRREKIRIHLNHVRFLEQFQKRFEDLVKELVIQKNRKLVVFVDDLDRCLPEKAIDVLEAIKLFLDVEGCIFVLGLDQNVIEQGIRVKYRDFIVEEKDDEKEKIPIDGAAYLQKIIQLPFLLPPIESVNMEEYVKSLVPRFPDECCVPVFAQGLREPNPRQVKRIMNVFLFLQRLAEKRNLPVTPVRLAKVIVIQHAHPALYEVLKEQKGLLRELERYFREEKGRLESAGMGEDASAERPMAVKGAKEGTPIHPRLAKFVSRASLRTLLTLQPADQTDVNFIDCTPEELRPYFTLTYRTAPKTPGAAPEGEFLEPQMVRVPAGTFQMGTGDEEITWLLKNTDWAEEWKKEGYFKREQPRHEIELPDFRIGKYPVMNSEYRDFIQDANHEPPSHWEGDSYPEGSGDHPVVNVSWDDAAAYCVWLSKKTKRQYRLPTEAEWEKAAGWSEKAEKRLRYPWGDEFDPRKCNTSEGDTGGTTPVGQYSPAGDSPYDAADMVGNVWEWCQDWYHEDYYEHSPSENPPGPEEGNLRVLRGGSWYGHLRVARCAGRYGFYPNLRVDFVGFRVAASPGSP